ncbi:MAG: hypothetical protein HFE30_07190 [Clostridiales bacterium]|nr:hypothetical protein [Clostridiales bacterium]
MTQIRLSSETRPELDRAIENLRPYIKRCRIPKTQTGRYIKAYIELKENDSEQKR